MNKKLKMYKCFILHSVHKWLQSHISVQPPETMWLVEIKRFNLKDGRWNCDYSGFWGRARDSCFSKQPTLLWNQACRKPASARWAQLTRSLEKAGGNIHTFLHQQHHGGMQWIGQFHSLCTVLLGQVADDGTQKLIGCIILPNVHQEPGHFSGQLFALCLVFQVVELLHHSKAICKFNSIRKKKKTEIIHT